VYQYEQIGSNDNVQRLADKKGGTDLATKIDPIDAIASAGAPPRFNESSIFFS
jgi:hypothetical protein